MLISPAAVCAADVNGDNIDDVVIQGAHSCGGECGHVIIDCNDNAPLCGCGQRGHVEAYASATGVIRRAQEALDAGRPLAISIRPRLKRASRKVGCASTARRYSASASANFCWRSNTWHSCGR